MSTTLASPERQYEIEQWYYREARMLDGRQYQSWLALCHPEIRYVIPGRGNPQVPNRERGKEDMISIERELEGVDSDGLPIRDETMAYLMLRVERSFKANAWSENPPARTRRIVGNIEILGEDDAGALSVWSAFHLHYARPGSASFLYAGQRRDVLAPGEQAGAYLLKNREVILDMAEVAYPTLGLFL